eukprot:CAMPEP_0179472300 /NCGR_PEP_ID=MMETSP0799-20121207/52329_1 /TAXON_ID=46947 /ORGANISM="Geminigera cryophila, Strain CCMP2564" /LENGTH=45 /DNA_ID= /DNA_START= /DNA_END= /DNA_ORIENTATION=
MVCCKCCKGQEETLKSYGGAAAYRANQPGITAAAPLPISAASNVT